MLTLFALSLPGLVVLIIVLGTFRLIRAKITGKPRPSSVSVGIDLLDVLLQPGSEYRIAEEEKNLVIGQTQASGDKPFSTIDAAGRKVTWKAPVKKNP